jgi:lipopolysaccharide transport system permease protein
MEQTVTSSVPVTAMDQPPQVAQPLHEVVIRPQRGWLAINWRELIEYRELLYFLVWRDVKVRYKQTILGGAWAIIQPLLSTIVFTVIFGYGMGRDFDGQPYAVAVFIGMLPWQLFSAGLTGGGLSLVNQQNLLTKIYLPRLFVPTSSIGGPFVDMLIGFGVAAALMVIYQVTPSPWIVLLPVLLAINIMAALGVAFTFSAMTVTYRDLRFLIPFISQILMWMSFVAFDVDERFERWTPLLSINPMFGIVGAFRSAILGVEWDWLGLGISTTVTVLLFVFGIFYFRKTERRFADIA